MSTPVGEYPKVQGLPRRGNAWPRAMARVGQFEDLGCSAQVRRLQSQLGRALDHGSLENAGGQLSPLSSAGQGSEIAVAGNAQPQKRASHTQPERVSEREDIGQVPLKSVQADNQDVRGIDRVHTGGDGRRRRGHPGTGGSRIESGRVLLSVQGEPQSQATVISPGVVRVLAGHNRWDADEPAPIRSGD